MDSASGVDDPRRCRPLGRLWAEGNFCLYLVDRSVSSRENRLRLEANGNKLEYGSASSLSWD